MDNNIKSKYRETRIRISRFKDKSDISDKQIIEELAEEIEEYRYRIIEQNKIIDELKTIQSEECTLDVPDELIDSDIEEIISTTKYANGKPVKTEMEYKYKVISEKICKEF